MSLAMSFIHFGKTMFTGLQRKSISYNCWQEQLWIAK